MVCQLLLSYVSLDRMWCAGIECGVPTAAHVSRCIIVKMRVHVHVQMRASAGACECCCSGADACACCWWHARDARPACSRLKMSKEQQEHPLSFPTVAPLPPPRNTLNAPSSLLLLCPHHNHQAPPAAHTATRLCNSALAEAAERFSSSISALSAASSSMAACFARIAASALSSSACVISCMSCHPKARQQ